MLEKPGAQNITAWSLKKKMFLKNIKGDDAKTDKKID